MLQVIISALFVYISTSIDYLILMTVIFSQFPSQRARLQVIFGQYFGVGFLIAVSLIASYFLNFIPEDWMVGLLGLVPIFLGIRIIIRGEENEEELLGIVNRGNANRLIWLVAFVNVAAGGDNLGVYIPYFASLSLPGIIVAILIFAISILLFSYICIRLADNKIIAGWIEKTEKWIVPLVFILLGIWILLENGTLQYLFS